MALFDCMTGVLANQSLNYIATGESPKRLGNKHPNICPYETVPVKDGYIILAVGNDKQFQRFCHCVGLSELAVDERFTSNAARVAQRDTLMAMINAKTQLWGKNELLLALEDAVVPAGPINTVADVFADPQFKAREMEQSLNGVKTIRTPIKMQGKSICADTHSPALGEHTDQYMLKT